MIKTAIRIVIKRGFCLFLITGIIISASYGQPETKNGFKFKTVVIDAGHGGKDPGSVGQTGTEKEVVLAIALKLGKYIETELPEIKVVYTRKTDEFIPLHKRADLANSQKADLYISIHANGNVSNLVSGTETLVLGLHRAGENFEVAKKENSVILLEEDYSTHYEGFDPNSPESYMIFSLMQNLYFEQSINFAAYIQNQFRERASRKDRGVKQQGLLVLARTSMPGVLIETGFMTNPEEEKFLLSEQGQDYIASAIFRAFRDYRNMMENKNTYFAGRNAVNDTDALHTPADTISPAKGSSTAPGQDAYIGESAGAGAGSESGSGSGSGSVSASASGLSTAPIVFKIQVLASATKIPMHDIRFRDFKKVSEYRVGNMYKYAIDGGNSYNETNAACRKMQADFPGAFIIAVRDSTIIPMDQALKEINTTTKNN